jgi:hypothetical protein
LPRDDAARDDRTHTATRPSEDGARARSRDAMDDDRARVRRERDVRVRRRDERCVDGKMSERCAKERCRRSSTKISDRARDRVATRGRRGASEREMRDR